jgi:hypothetical protein
MGMIPRWPWGTLAYVHTWLEGTNKLISSIFNLQLLTKECNRADAVSSLVTSVYLWTRLHWLLYSDKACTLQGASTSLGTSHPYLKQYRPIGESTAIVASVICYRQSLVGSGSGGLDLHHISEGMRLMSISASFSARQVFILSTALGQMTSSR